MSFDQVGLAGPGGFCARCDTSDVLWSADLTCLDTVQGLSGAVAFVAAPLRHTQHFHDLTFAEVDQLMALVRAVDQVLCGRFGSSGNRVGFDTAAAWHLGIQLVPAFPSAPGGAVRGYDRVALRMVRELAVHPGLSRHQRRD